MVFSLLLSPEHATSIPLILFIFLQFIMCITGGVVFLSAAHALVL